jgi:hypothetical protein
MPVAPVPLKAQQRDQRLTVFVSILGGALVMLAVMVAYGRVTGGPPVAPEDRVRFLKTTTALDAGDVRAPPHTTAVDGQQQHPQRGAAMLSAPAIVIRFSNRNGRHNNQLKGVLHGIALARIVAQSPVLPSSTVDLVIPAFRGPGGTTDFSAVYSMDALTRYLRSSTPHLTLRELVPKGSTADGRRRTDVFFTRKGIPKALDYQARLQVECPTEDSCRKVEIELTTRNFDQVAKVVILEAITAATEPTKDGQTPTEVHLHFNELMYYDHVVEGHQSFPTAPPLAADLWAAIEPSSAIALHVAEALTAIAPASASAALRRIRGVPAGARANPDAKTFVGFDGVHVRTLEGSCASRVAHMKARKKLPFAINDTARDLSFQCRYATELLKPTHFLWPSNRGLAANSSKLFVASDSDPTKVSIVAAAKGSAVTLSREVLDSIGRRKPEGVSKAKSKKEGQSTKEPSLEAAVGVLDEFKSKGLQDLEPVVLDMWLLVASDRFAGNVASTLSRNVCSLRQARGLIDPADTIDCVLVSRDAPAS